MAAVTSFNLEGNPVPTVLVVEDDAAFLYVISRELAAAGILAVLVGNTMEALTRLAAERQISAARGQDRSDPLERCDQLAVTRRVFELIWRVDQELKPRLQVMLARRSPTVAYHHVTTVAESEAIDQY